MGSKPTNERQVRPLLRLKPEQQPAAWEAAVADAKEEGAERPTARHVTAAVEQVLGTVEPEEGPAPSLGAVVREITTAIRCLRETHGTYEAYARDRFGMEKTYAYGLANVGAVVGRLSAMAEKPENERQVRPLLKLEPAQQAERPAARHL